MRYSRLVVEAFVFIIWLLVWEFVFKLRIASNMFAVLFGIILIRIAFNWYYTGK